jgi:hypothetical protein
LNDAGLDMKYYLEENPPTAVHNYITTGPAHPLVAGCFTHLFLRQEHTSFLIYVGDKTYSSIKTTNKRFIDALYPFQPEVKAVPLNRKHVPMVTQYFILG